MKKLIKKILNEDRRQMYLDKIVHVMKNDFPIIKNLKDYGFTEQLSDDEYRYIMNKIFGEPVKRRGYDLFNKNGYNIYKEFSDGKWWKNEYDENNRRTYYESYDGYWKKSEYDENNRRTYYETSDGKWEKREYDENNRRTYYEDSTGYWRKWEYDEDGNRIYYEDSRGEIIDNR